MTTEFDDLTAKLKDALEARYRAGYEAALHELVGHIADKLGLRPKPTAQEQAPTEQKPAEQASTPTNGSTNLPKYLQRAYERLKMSPGITSRIARKEWGGGSNVLYQLHKAGLAEKDGSKFYAVER
jgi:hypothetical protein